ncbi:uncharacterized protein LOC134667087 [Cydia fagiglandana]|uniref:uncharacterized protein LOC134667087 n=1 Tax=Cydia fagiglandana TaxID=1458189 RepID=UPI002FEE2390
MSHNDTNIKPFDGTNWEAFEKQLQCLLLVNDIPEEKKVPLLITKLTTTVFDNILNICEPVSPLTKSYDELCSLLKKNYTNTKAPSINRVEFRKRNQTASESIDQYITELRKIARTCGFKDMEDQIKEKFIDGLTSNPIKFELLKNSELSLEKFVILARSIEAALKTTETTESKNITPMFKNTSVNYRSTNTRRGQGRGGLAGANNSKMCYCCGKNNHIRAECSLQKKYCSECGRQGHIYKMCPNNKMRRSTNMVSTDEHKPEDEGTEDIFDGSLAPLFQEYEVRSLGRQNN